METGPNEFWRLKPRLQKREVALRRLGSKAATEGGAGVRQLLKRILQWRVGITWYLAAICLTLLIWLTANSLLYRGAPLMALAANPLVLVTAFLPNVLFGLFIPSLGEEVGWHGFALPRLQPWAAPSFTPGW